MTNLNALTNYVKEFCQEIQALEAQYGLSISIDFDRESLSLSNTHKPTEVITWLGVDTVKYKEDYAFTDYDALGKIIDTTSTEDIEET
jgi:hypothetical protein